MFPLLRVETSFVLHTLTFVNSPNGVIALLEIKLLGLVGVGVVVGVVVGDGVGDGDGDGVGLGVGIGVGVGVGFGLAVGDATFQISFLPLLVHTYFLPAEEEICPAFLQLPPAFIAAVASMGAMSEKTTVRESRILFMGRVLGLFQRMAMTRSCAVDFSFLELP